MYAAHFAMGLAIGSRARQSPTWALLIGAFLPDLAWIGLAALGVEPSTPIFFDDWSHSLASVIVLATAFALFFLSRGVRVWVPVWAAVGSHFLLDAVIHPKPLALFPHSRLHMPWDLWQWGAAQAWLGFTRYWWIQFLAVTPLLVVYARGARRDSLPTRLVAATCLIVLGLHLLL